MPSWAWVVTYAFLCDFFLHTYFNALMGLSCYSWFGINSLASSNFNALMGLSCYIKCLSWAVMNTISMPSWAWVVTGFNALGGEFFDISMPSWAWVVTLTVPQSHLHRTISMPSWAWVVTVILIHLHIGSRYFNALMGLSCYCKNVQYFKFFMILFMHPCYL